MVSTLGIFAIIIGLALALIGIAFYSKAKKSNGKAVSVGILAIGAIVFLGGLFLAATSPAPQTTTTTTTLQTNTTSYQECSIADVYLNSTNSSGIDCPGTLASAELLGVGTSNATFEVKYAGTVLNSSVTLSTSLFGTGTYYFAYGNQSFSLQLLDILNATSAHSRGAGVQLNVKK